MSVQILQQVALDANMATTKLGRVSKALPDLKQIDRIRKGIQRTDKAIKNFDDAFGKSQKELQRVKDGLGKALPDLKELKKTTTNMGKELTKAQKLVDKLGKVVKPFNDFLFQKVAPDKLGILLNSLAGIATAGMVAFGAKVGEEVVDINTRIQNVVSKDLDRQLKITLDTKRQVDNLERRTTANDEAIDVMAGVIGEKTKYIDRMINEFQLKVDGQKQIQDSQQRLISNLADTFRQVTPTISQARSEASQAKADIQKVQALIKTLTNAPSNQGGNATQPQVVQLANRVSKVEQEVKQNDKEIETLKKGVNVQSNIIQAVQGAVNASTSAVSKVEELKKELPALLKKSADDYAIPQAYKLADGKIEKIKAEFKGEIKNFVDKDMMITEVTAAVGNQIIRVGVPIMDSKLEPYKASDAFLQSKINDLTSRVGEQQKNAEGLKRDIETSKGEIEDVKQKNKEQDRKIQEQDKVNQEGNRKLDELLKWTLTIPPILTAIPAKTGQIIIPKIPTIPQIGQAVRDNTPQQTCRFDPKPINSHTTALDVVQTALIVDGNQTIKKVDETTKIMNNKLGGQIAGGISGKLMRFSAWIQLDRVLNLLTFAATVQNHLMLSREIGTTLLGAFSNILNLIGLKDDEGQPYKIGDIINSSIENLIKGIVGAENYATLSEAWAKANRIYQATTNVLNSFQQLSSTILSAMELIAGNNSKIGNALKKAGIVLETAYGWMNPQPKFNRVTQALEKFQASASTIQMVTQAPLDIINATTELQNANTELIKAVKEDNKPENKAPEIPEPDELKAKETESKSVSQPLPFDFSDLFDGED